MTRKVYRPIKYGAYEIHWEGGDRVRVYRKDSGTARRVKPEEAHAVVEAYQRERKEREKAKQKGAGDYAP